MRIGPGRQPPPLLQREAALRQCRGHRLVHRRVGDDRDTAVVLGCRPHHGRAADVDLLDALGRPGAAGHRLLERVQVRHQQLERGDPQIS